MSPQLPNAVGDYPRGGGPVGFSPREDAGIPAGIGAAKVALRDLLSLLLWQHSTAMGLLVMYSSFLDPPPPWISMQSSRL